MRIPEHNYTPREQTVVDILRDRDVRGILNVGFRNWMDPRNHWWIKICEANNIPWHILEVFEPNVKDIIARGCREDKITCGNIQDISDVPEGIDTLLFWHGPEHLKKEEMLALVPSLENLFPNIIFGMPLGEEPQGAAYDNPYENHISVWYPEDWEKLGYEVIGVQDHQKHAHITVSKFNNGES